MPPCQITGLSRNQFANTILYNAVFFFFKPKISGKTETPLEHPSYQCFENILTDLHEVKRNQCGRADQPRALENCSLEEDTSTFAKYKIMITTATTNFCINALDFIRFIFLYKLFYLIFKQSLGGNREN